jgi:trk system potassium uptake protein TrkA
MIVIVCGAGQAGTNIVRHFAVENHDVTMIDRSSEPVRRAGSSLFCATTW